MRDPTHLSLHRSLFIFVIFFLALSNVALAFRSSDGKTFRKTIFRRQSDAPFNNGIPETVQTVETESTAQGLVSLTCTITLTPVVVNGQNLVREDKTCVTSPVFGNGSNAPQLITTVNRSAQQTVNTVQTFATTPAIQTPPPQIFSTTTAALVTPVFPPATTVATPAFTPAATTPASIFTPVFGTPTATQAATTPNGTAAAANASQSTGFTLPGQKLQVLPIGLGVFAGISVIALIVVGIVTYERTKYRKAFRARKLAEQAAAMGYGGMSTRG